MTRSEMIAYINANPYHKISHKLFADDEYIYVGQCGYVYEENGYLFEDWYDPIRWDGLRERKGGAWEDGWYVKEAIEPCQYHFAIPTAGICCRAYYESKDARGRTHMWGNYPNCNEKNCPLKYPELLEGNTLETEDNAND